MFSFGKVTQIALFSSASVFTLNEFYQSLFPLLFIVLALFMGIKIRDKINPMLYAKMVKIVLFFIGTALFIQTI